MKGYWEYKLYKTSNKVYTQYSGYQYKYRYQNSKVSFSFAGKNFVKSYSAVGDWCMHQDRIKNIRISRWTELFPDWVYFIFMIIAFVIFAFEIRNSYKQQRYKKLIFVVVFELILLISIVIVFSEFFRVYWRWWVEIWFCDKFSNFYEHSNLKGNQNRFLSNNKMASVNIYIVTDEILE